MDEQGSATIAATEVSPSPETELGLSARFRQVRRDSEAICAALETEDYVVQPAAYVSPPKWHLAHTTWFFDRFILQALGRDCRPAVAETNLIFNSYYKSQGSHWLQENRGHLSRPTVQQVLDWRAEVTAQLDRLLQEDALDKRHRQIVELGIQHEQQHQELLWMDVKYILAGHPWHPAYDELSRPQGTLPALPVEWIAYSEGVREFGAGAEGFAYDNERPCHRQWLAAHQLANRLVSNQDYLAFMEDGGYRRAEHWLSDGWDWLQAHGISHPLYWHWDNDQWHEYHLGGLQPLCPGLPVSHVSYFEADAYARWANARLPTEFELEHLLRQQRALAQDGAAGWAPGEPLCPLPAKAGDGVGNGLLWQWSSSAYSPYPGFIPEAGALGEYNGKFMNNQYVLKGGCVATPRGHLRHSYRNFYRPEDRWAFTGIRLAKD